MNRPPCCERAARELGEERGRERVEAEERALEQAQRVGLDRARLGVDARDRARVDLVAQVGARGLAAGDDRVGEGLEDRAVDRHRGARGVGGQDALGHRQRAEHQRSRPERRGARQEVPPR